MFVLTISLIGGVSITLRALTMQTVIATTPLKMIDITEQDCNYSHFSLIST
jgi:hypothetical protein